MLWCTCKQYWEVLDRKSRSSTRWLSNKLCQDGQERASKPIPLLAPTTAIVFPSIPTFAILGYTCWNVECFKAWSAKTYYRSS